ncbi:helix-turn-helix protein binding domain protein [Mycobacterium phage Boilgate]|nr:helix-turn-helix protein binding domain protein [Mycobacterium phage Boilgate]
MANKCKACQGRAELVVCWRCAKRLHRLLVGNGNEPGLDWYADRLAEQAYGQARMGRPQRKPGGPAPLPLNPAAADLLAEITRSLAAWAAEALGVSGRTNFSAAAYCAALTRDPARLMAVECAPKMLVDAERFNRNANRLINRPPDKYCGPCPNVLDNSGQQCGMDLRAEPDERMVQCRRCRSVFDVEALRDRLLARVDDEPKTAADLLRLFRWLGVDVKRSTFYHRLNRVPPRMFLHRDGTRNDRHADGAKPLYAYSDVVAAIATDRERV